MVIFCNYVVANYGGSTTIVKHDEYGFTLVNFYHLIPLSIQSFAFPMHVNKVLFIKDVKLGGNWKVVMC
jgi:hypothetical protein